MIKENKRGWVKLVEAFLSVLLVGAILGIIINQQVTPNNGFSATISNYQVYMLRGIELNESLREDILGISPDYLPANWDSGSFPTSVKDRITNSTPGFLTCEAQVCKTNETCTFWGEIDKNVYAQRIFIASTYSVYEPRQLKLFCWGR